jgi:D-3-phosphoglycerate dehydrogenase
MPRSPAYIIDFDSTLVTRESLDDLAELALRDNPDRESICEQLQLLTVRGMTGEMPFDASLTARLALFSAHLDHVALLNDQLSTALSPSAARQADWFKANAERVYVVSGGFEEIIKPTVERLGILATNVYANRFLLDGDGNVVGYDPSRLTAQAGGKAAQVRELGLNRPVISIGDGSTDLEIRLRGEADEFWAFTETVTRPTVIERADRVLTSFLDLA